MKETMVSMWINAAALRYSKRAAMTGPAAMVHTTHTHTHTSSLILALKYKEKNIMFHLQSLCDPLHMIQIIPCSVLLTNQRRVKVPSPHVRKPWITRCSGLWSLEITVSCERCSWSTSQSERQICTDGFFLFSSSGKYECYYDLCKNRTEQQKSVCSDDNATVLNMLCNLKEFMLYKIRK